MNNLIRDHLLPHLIEAEGGVGLLGCLEEDVIGIPNTPEIIDQATGLTGEQLHKIKDVSAELIALLTPLVRGAI